MARTIIQGSEEFISLIATEKVDGSAATSIPTSSISVALTPYGERPTTYSPATELNGKPGYMLSGNEAVGDYSLWVQISANPETVLRVAGAVTIVSGV